MLADVDPGGCVARLLRAGVLAGSCGSLAVAAHVGGNGAAPPLATLALGQVVLLRFAYAVDARERAGWQLAAFVGLAQLGLHVLFVVAPLSHSTGMRMGGDAAMLAPTPRMLAAHAAAAAAVALALRHGERALWAASRLLRGLPERHRRPWSGAVPIGPVVAFPVAAVVEAVPVTRSRRLMLARARDRRGPPVLSHT
jgi:hypothetical protein